MSGADTAVVLGSQAPTHRLVPAADYSKGDLALEMADLVGLELDAWQRDWQIDALGVSAASGREKWAAMEGALELSRQNGKSVGFEVRALTGLYIFRERLIVYTAHKSETAMAAFQRIVDLIHSDGELKREVLRVRTANGKESIELRDPLDPSSSRASQVLKFRTRTAGGGRGLAGDCVLLDEAQDLRDEHIAALFPVMSARSQTGSPQIWYAGSAGGKASVVLGRLVRRMAAGDTGLVMYRWAASDDDDPSSVDTWAKTNPALGVRISVDFVAQEQRAMSPGKFARERLGIGDYPREEGEDWVIPQPRWDAGEDRDSQVVGPVVFSVEVKWDREAASIAVAGWRSDGKKHLEVVANEGGTRWVPDRLRQILDRNAHLGVVIDPKSPAASLIGPLRDAGVEVQLLKLDDTTTAFASLYDGFMADDPEFRHTGGTLLTQHLAEATTRDVNGSTTWRRAVTEDVTAILAATWAQHGLDILAVDTEPPPPPLSAGGRGSAGAGETADLGTHGF